MLRSFSYKKKVIEFSPILGEVASQPQALSGDDSNAQSFEFKAADGTAEDVHIAVADAPLQLGDAVTLIRANEQARASDRYRPDPSKETRYSALVNHSKQNYQSITPASVLNRLFRIEVFNTFSYILALLLAFYVFFMPTEDMAATFVHASDSAFLQLFIQPSWVYSIIVAALTVFFSYRTKQRRGHELENRLQKHMDRLAREVLDEGPNHQEAA